MLPEKAHVTPQQPAQGLCKPVELASHAARPLAAHQGPLSTSRPKAATTQARPAGLAVGRLAGWQVAFPSMLNHTMYSKFLKLSD